MILSFEKKKGSCDCLLFSYQGTGPPVPEWRWHLYLILSAKLKLQSLLTRKVPPLFSAPEGNGKVIRVIRHLPLLDNIIGKLISLQHCSSRNRKTLHQIVHILKFLAWLSTIIKQNAPKLVSQWSVIQILRDQDLSKEICVDIRNLRNEIYQDNLIVAK